DLLALLAELRGFGGGDALLGRHRLALELRKLAVDARQLPLDLRDARVDHIEALLRVLHPLLADLVVLAQAAQLRHALAVDRPLADLERALDALVLGHRLDAL